MNDLTFCADSTPTFLHLFDLSIAPTLLFYSYIPIAVLCLFVGCLIFFRDSKSLVNKLFLGIAISFVAWILNILVQWIGVHSSVVHFAWQMTAVFELPIYIFSVYFVYVFITKADIKFSRKLILTIITLPVIILLSTRYNVDFFDFANCEGAVGYLWHYIYVVEVLLLAWIVYSSIKRYRKISDGILKKEVLLLTVGMVFFLGLFYLSNLTGEITQLYEINLIGPLGMAIFIGFLSYLIVKFKAFNMRLVGANVLVFALWILVLSLLFINDLRISHIVTIISIVPLGIFGVLIIRGIKKEVQQREEIELLAEDLKKANTRLKELDTQKSEFVSFASHQLRSPLTAMKGYASLILEGDYGEVNKEVKGAVTTIYDSSQTLASVVDDYLNISRIELGTMKYAIAPLDWSKMVSEIISELKPNIAKAGLAIDFTFDAGDTYTINADLDKFKQVIANLIDNSVKYTPSGSIHVSLAKNKETGKILFAVKDTGIGMSGKTIPKLFQKFTRADKANETNIRGTGLGLYVAAEIVKAHNGKIWAASEGEGKGSQFYVEMDGK